MKHDKPKPTAEQRRQPVEAERVVKRPDGKRPLLKGRRGGQR